MSKGGLGEGNIEALIVDTKAETDRKCPSCSGVMDFNPATGKLTCPYCGYEEEIKVNRADFVAEELDFSKAEDGVVCDWGTATKSVLCKACGAETVYDVNQIANECPYCGSNQVMEAAGKNIMAPGGVVTFQYTADQAADLFRKWIGGKFFCPKAAKESARADEMNGIYVPFWTFDAKTTSNYNGEYGIEREEKDKDGNTKTETDWYKTMGLYEEFFDDMLICGSAKQGGSMINSLEPYDTTKAVEYKPEYMSGFSAERYTVKVKDAWKQAKDRMKDKIKSAIDSKIRDEKHADDIRNLNIDTKFKNVTYKYLLLPVWISSYKYNGKVYQFMVNGQTGKISGKSPVSAWKVTLTIAIIVAALALLIKSCS